MIDVITIVVALAVSLAALYFVIKPLVQKEVEPFPLENDRLSELISRKDSVLAAIKELEFDHQVGKLSAADFDGYNQRLRRQAISYIQQIENLAPEAASLDEALEAEIAALRRTLVAERESAGPTPPVTIPSPPPPPDTRTPDPTVRYCTSCGQPIEPSHKFCAHCGAAVAIPVAASDSR